LAGICNDIEAPAPDADEALLEKIAELLSQDGAEANRLRIVMNALAS
jgi:hypothetical protein